MSIDVHPMSEAEHAGAARILRAAFATYLGVPEPERFWEDVDFVKGRWTADPSAAFTVVLDGELAGSNFATRWGSVGFFGPLSIRPDLWDRGLGKRLMEPVLEAFDRWGVTHAGLFTFAQSAKHVGLYQRFGFWPRALTAVMTKPVQAGKERGAWTGYASVAQADRAAVLRAAREVTEAVYPGLEVDREILAVHAQGLGDTVLLWEGGELAGFAVCHWGAGTEAGKGKAYVKFGAVRPGPQAERQFTRLLEACEAAAAEQKLALLEAGVNTARHEAYLRLLDQGYRTAIQGVAMQRGNEAGYNRPGVYLIDDWR